MICSFCSQNITDDDLKCPFCGQDVGAPTGALSDNAKKNEEFNPDTSTGTKGGNEYNFFEEISEIITNITHSNFLNKYFQTEEEDFEEAYLVTAALKSEQTDSNLFENENTLDGQPVREFCPAESIRNKKLSFRRKLQIQLMMQILFGYSGIPAMFRTNKWFGFVQFILFVSAIVLVAIRGLWQPFVVVAWFYFTSIVTLLIRISLYRRRKREYNQIKLKQSDINRKNIKNSI